MKEKLLKPAVSERDHIRGARKAPISLVEYGDFECHYCGQAYRIVHQILEELPGQVCFVFRNFPLPELHPHAEMAAEAAEAAGAQGKFWEMHDILFENQAALDPDSLVSYAENIGLDVNRFVKDLNRGRFARRISEQVRGGVNSGVDGTPIFFIDGVLHEGPWDFDALTDALENELARRKVA